VTTLEGTTSTLASTVSDNSQTINNIIAAGFNLIGVDVPNEP
jgi:N-acetylglucosamine-6-phosphate deacetylase